MSQVIHKLTTIAIISACIGITGCTTYGRGENQIEVTDQVEAEQTRKQQSLSMLQDINKLEAENSELKNQVEVLQYDLDQAIRRIDTQQVELDRLYQAEGLTGYTYSDGQGVTDDPVTGMTESSVPGSVPVQTQEIEVGTTQSGSAVIPSTQSTSQSVQPTSPQVMSTLSAQELYDSGFEQLKQGQYPESIQTFSQLLAAHPSSTYADDAQYWSGEAYYVNRDYSSSLAAFNSVVNNYPGSDRAPDAMLKIGYIYYEQGDVDNARSVFNSIISRYPNERVSDFAKERLKNL